ncbi:hypothetical protein BO79DRAFT_345 [Aspergillus costaricaensis CBS 115574]|uniref:Uncharacterized protein n=1 Tax=Aspergillus costaricaensis CBS 115574 TaxID=1448317 RepID=A0ACD1IVF5_9EURO|nr:hypothetical protein BO79DRAFT_345 [Aspergillus costaricaensis CBS 115574]RAK94044.1 hypothetical protein BO79DRAFT_345 [Aspergillus costaricaensis CBS 115574]
MLSYCHIRFGRQMQLGRYVDGTIGAVIIRLWLQIALAVVTTRIVCILPFLLPNTLNQFWRKSLHEAMSLCLIYRNCGKKSSKADPSCCMRSSDFSISMRYCLAIIL